jgi:hypothetical protein
LFITNILILVNNKTPGNNLKSYYVSLLNLLIFNKLGRGLIGEDKPKAEKRWEGTIFEFPRY